MTPLSSFSFRPNTHTHELIGQEKGRLGEGQRMGQTLAFETGRLRSQFYKCSLLLTICQSFIHFIICSFEMASFLLCSRHPLEECKAAHPFRHH